MDESAARAPRRSGPSSGACTDETCGWYHDSWPHLRTLGIVSGPDDHAAFYQRALTDCAGDATTDILISGAADEAMLRHVVGAIHVHDPRLRITVVDICAAPLDRCVGYAEERGLRVETVRSDLTTWTPTRQFDLIVTDSFLTRFPPDRRSTVFDAWRRLLRPGGHVVTTAGFSGTDTNGKPVRMTSAESSRFVRRAADAARRSATADSTFTAGPSAPAIERYAWTYSSRLTTYPFRNDTALADAFVGAGFDVIHSESAHERREFIFAGMTRIVAGAPVSRIV